MDKQSNKTNLKVLAALGLMMTTSQAVAIQETSSLQHRHKSHHHHRHSHNQQRPDESDNLIIGAPKTTQSPEQLAERRTLDVVREELQAELHNSDDDQEHQDMAASEFSQPEQEQEQKSQQKLAQYEKEIEEYKPEPILMRKPVQSSKTANLIAQAIIHQNQKAQGMTDDQIYGGASAASNDESEFGFGSKPAEAPQPIAEKIQQIEQKPNKPKFQMAEQQEQTQDAQENAVQKTLQLIKSRQSNSFVEKPKHIFSMFSTEEKPAQRESEKIVSHTPKKVIHKKPIIVKKPKVIIEEENAQAEIDAMLEVEKRQESLRNKQVGGSSKSLVQDSKPTGVFGDHMDMHIDSSIIDKVRNDTDQEMKDIENESSRHSSVAQKGEESSSEEEELTEQEKLYGRSETREHRHKSTVKSAPVVQEQKVEQPEIVSQIIPEVKQKYNLSQAKSFESSAEDAKQMAVQKTLALINKFKSNENHEEQASVSPVMSFPEPVQQSHNVRTHTSYDKDAAIQNILKTIRQKHNLPPTISKKPLVAPTAPKKKVEAVSQEVQDIQDKIDQTKLEMRKLPNAPEYGIETSKLDIDESDFVTKVKPQNQSSVKETVKAQKVEGKKVKRQDTTFQIETTKIDVPDFEASKLEAAPVRKQLTQSTESKKALKPQVFKQKKVSDGNEYKIETTSVDMESLKSIVGDTSDLDLEKMQAQELSKIQAEKKRQERLKKEAEEKRLEDEKIEIQRIASEKKAAEEEEERQRKQVVQEQIIQMKKLQQQQQELKEKEEQIKKQQQQSNALKNLPLTVPVINNKDPKVSQSLAEQTPRTIPGEIKQMNRDMRGMLKEIVETIQPALEESVGPENNARVKVVVTPKNGSSLSQKDSAKSAQEFTFDDTRSLNTFTSVTDPETQQKKVDGIKISVEKKPEAFPTTPVKADSTITQAPKPMGPPFEEAQKTVASTASDGPSQSQIQNAIQATLSKIKADKSVEVKSVEDFKQATQKVEEERYAEEAKAEALEKVQKAKEEEEQKSRMSNLKDSVVAKAIKMAKAKAVEDEKVKQSKKKEQEVLKKKQDQVKALAKQETENMDDLIKVGEQTHKNPAISNVVANTIALMKKQKSSMSSSPFSHLFDTLHGEALMQQSESAKVSLPGEQKTAVKSQDQLSNIKAAVKASVVPSKKSLIQLNEDPIDVNIKVKLENDDSKTESKDQVEKREQERAEAEKKQKEEEAKCTKERSLEEAQNQIGIAKKSAKEQQDKRQREIDAHDREQAKDEQKQKEIEGTLKRVDNQYKNGQKIVGITMDAATKAQNESAEAVNAAGAAKVVDNRKQDDSEDKKDQAAKDAAQEKEHEKFENQTSGELVKAKTEAKDIQSAIDKVTYTEEKENFLKEQTEKQTKEAQEVREKALQEQKKKEQETRKEDEIRAKILKETNEEIKARQAREQREKKDLEEAKALKELTIYKTKQEQLTKEREAREAKSKAEAEEQRKQEFEQKEKDLAENERKIDLEKRKLEDKLKREKEEDEKEAREAQQKAKYDAAFKDGEYHKSQEYSSKAKAEAEKRKQEETAIKEYERKQVKQEELEKALQTEKNAQEKKDLQAYNDKVQAQNEKERERKASEERERRLQEQRDQEKEREREDRRGGRRNRDRDDDDDKDDRRSRGGRDSYAPTSAPQRGGGGYNNPYPQQNSYGGQPTPPPNQGYNNGYQNYQGQGDNYLQQKSSDIKKTQDRKSVSAIAKPQEIVKKVEDRKSVTEVQASAPKAEIKATVAPVYVAVSTVTTTAPVAAKPEVLATTTVVTPKATAAATPAAKVETPENSVATVTSPKDETSHGTILIQSEDKPSTIILDQKDEKDTELFNKADVQDENWLQLTFHKIGMNVKNVFNKLFLPQLQSSSLSHQEKIELMMLWEEHHDQDDK